MRQKASRVSKIVVIGGGTGSFTVLSGLRKYPVELCAVITMADNGGSTGILREEFGILPPGDIRQALVALSSADRMVADLFNYRFQEGGLKTHAFGNIMLTALERITGSFEQAVEEAGQILNIRGRVLPVTLENVCLCAELKNNHKIRGEANIDPHSYPEYRIKKMYLDPRASINPKAGQAIAEADLIILGPGNLLRSIVPNLLVKGVKQAIQKSNARKVFISNTMGTPGETSGFTAADFLRVVETYLGRNVLDYILINTKHPSPNRLKSYLEEGKMIVEPGTLPRKPTPVYGNFMRKTGFVRHDPGRLSKILVSLL